MRIENPQKIEAARDIIGALAAALNPSLLRHPVNGPQSLAYLGRLVAEANRESPTKTPFDILYDWSLGSDKRANNLQRRGLIPENIKQAEILYIEKLG